MKITKYCVCFLFIFGAGIFQPVSVTAESRFSNSSNFGLPGILELPSAYRLSDGEFLSTQIISETLVRTGVSSQFFPRLGFTFRYSGQGNKSINHPYQTGRVNHDRSFDAHLTIWDEAKYRPALSLGLRDFIGTGWYSSEYAVLSKKMGEFEFTGGLGFGRLAGKNLIDNPLANFSSFFKSREANYAGRLGGTLGTINWFRGPTSPFAGVNYHLSNNLIVSAEYSPDLMKREEDYLNLRSYFNYGISYKLNKVVSLSAQYLHGSTVTFRGSVSLNPNKPLNGPGLELAPVPMRLRSQNNLKNSINLEKTNEATIEKVLKADKFKILNLKIDDSIIRIDIENNKFRSVAQAVGRISSTLQRFTSDEVKYGIIAFHSSGLQTAVYKIDLVSVSDEQFGEQGTDKKNPSILISESTEVFREKGPKDRFNWSLGPYFTHRLFNPDLPLSAETGAEIVVKYNFSPHINISTSLRKSILTNLTDNQRRSNSVLPRVHSDWPLYDFAGQNGHINNLTLSFMKSISPNLHTRTHLGYLEPFFAGLGGEILYKPANSSLAVGLDVHHVQKRDYEMLFGLRNYTQTIGHISFYFDNGGPFGLELNMGKYLAGDWGATTTIYRIFNNGWEVGGYATLTEIPFETFGEGSFDKGIYATIPIDWIIGKPDKSRRKFVIRPITRDGGARLASARSLYRVIKGTQNSQFIRENARIWK